MLFKNLWGNRSKAYPTIRRILKKGFHRVDRVKTFDCEIQAIIKKSRSRRTCANQGFKGGRKRP